MAHHVEPMDVDNMESDFDNKENTFHNSNLLLSTEKGYEELDVSELNMKLRYSITPNSSPMSKSYTANCVDNRTYELDNENQNLNENGNLTRSLNLSINRNENNTKPLKTLPLQSRSTEQFVDGNRNASVLRPIDTTLTDTNNVTVTVTDIDENISFPSSSSSATHTPEATTPTKEIPRQETGSPIMRGLKSVLNMFRPSQSPIPPAETENEKPEMLSPAEVTSPMVDNAVARTKTILASTPIATSKNKDPNSSKRSSPHKDSIVFNEDLEKELQWKDETTILFSQEKIPIHKLFFQSSKASDSKAAEVTSKQSVVESGNTTLEYMDISYNESIKDTTIEIQAPKLNESNIAPESDSEFVDCETTFTKNESQVKEKAPESTKPAEIKVDNNLEKQENGNNSAIDEPLKLDVTEVFNVQEATQSLDLLNQSAKVDIAATAQDITPVVPTIGDANLLEEVESKKEDNKNLTITVLPDLLEVNRTADVKVEDVCANFEESKIISIEEHGLEQNLDKTLENTPVEPLPNVINSENLNNTVPIQNEIMTKDEISVNKVNPSTNPEQVENIISNIEVRSSANITQNLELNSTVTKINVGDSNINSNITQEMGSDTIVTAAEKIIVDITKSNTTQTLDTSSTFTKDIFEIHNEVSNFNLDLIREMSSNGTFVASTADSINNINTTHDLSSNVTENLKVNADITQDLGSISTVESVPETEKNVDVIDKANITNPTFVKDVAEESNINDVTKSKLDSTQELGSNATFVANADDSISNANITETKLDETNNLDLQTSTFVKNVAEKIVEDIVKLSNTFIANESEIPSTSKSDHVEILTDIPADIPLPDEDDIDKEFIEPADVSMQADTHNLNTTINIIGESKSEVIDTTKMLLNSTFETKPEESITVPEDKAIAPLNVGDATSMELNKTQEIFESGQSHVVEDKVEPTSIVNLPVDEPMDISIVDMQTSDNMMVMIKTISNADEKEIVVNEAIPISEEATNVSKNDKQDVKSDSMDTPVLVTESQTVIGNSIPDVVPMVEETKMPQVEPVTPLNQCDNLVPTPAESVSCLDQDTHNKEELKQIVEEAKDNNMIPLASEGNKLDKQGETETLDVPKKNDEIKANDIVDAVEEEIIVSENNSPYVSLSADAIPEDNQVENFEEIENPFKTNTKIASSPPLSPKIVSKGYNFNFDEIDDPFATKTKIRLSPPPTTSANQSFEATDDFKPVKKAEVPKKAVDKNRRKSQPERRKLAATKRSFNATFDGAINTTETEKPVVPLESSLQATSNNKEKIDKENIPEVQTDNTQTPTQSTAMEIDHTSESIETSDSNKTIQIKEATEEKSEPILSKTVIESPKHNENQNVPTPDLLSSSEKAKATSSSEQSFYSAGTSSSEGNNTKNIFNLPEINDMNFNPFATKSKMRASPPPSLDVDDPFATKTKIKSSPDTSMVIQQNIEHAVVNTTVAVESVQQLSISSALPEDKHSEATDKDASINISNTTCSSKTTEDKDCTVREVHTEDEDTEEGPFLEADEFKTVDKILEFGNENADMLQFNELPPQENDENAEGELFIDAEAFEFLLNQNKSNTVAESGKESLFLKFDPLFAKRISTDGVLAALNKVQKRQSTPKKTAASQQNETLAAESSPIPGPSTLNITHDVEVNNTVLDNNEDFNITVSKPMMVVTPAVNPVVTPRTKSTTPTRTNRRSITFTSPAMAVIDRLLSLSANNSLVGHETTVTQVSREQHEADLALTQLRELLAEKEIHVYNLRSESKELKDRLATMETQMKSLETEGEKRLKNINELNERLAEKTKMNRSMAVVVEEYERTIASLIAETEQDKKRHAEERIKLIKERDEQTAHLASMEVSFSDLHSKYEKSKQIILACKANEDTYKKSIKDFEDNLAKMQTNYELLKQHASSKLNHANQELEKMNRAHEAEVVKLNAMIKRKELHITSLEETLAQKTKANEELTAICDELINKVG